MRRVLVVLVLAGIGAFSFIPAGFCQEAEWQNLSAEILNVQAVLVEPDNPKVIYAGTEGSVFRSEDSGKSWKRILSVRGGSRKVNFLAFSPKDKNALYAATGNGLFYSENSGQAWKKIFRDECTVIAVLPQGIYLGTKAGFFASRDNGRTWQRADRIFGKWQRVFGDETDESAGDGIEEREELDEICSIAADKNDFNPVYLATPSTIYVSRDNGQNWESFSDYGLLGRRIKFIFVSYHSLLYAVTEAGIFTFFDGRWQELSLRLVSNGINSLTADAKENIYAACVDGLFKIEGQGFFKKSPEGITALYYRNEPKISEVQKAAIKYAEVDPDKIRQWRQQAAKKAVLPKISTSINRDTADLWHWESGSTTKTGDDVLVRGRETVEWDVTLAWDLGEIIWNNDQTSIDVRSRLMVELRDNILDEVNRIYFERLRVKMELDRLSIEDRKKRIEKELRLEELTASLDALTGGYFSQSILTVVKR